MVRVKYDTVLIDENGEENHYRDYSDFLSFEDARIFVNDLFNNDVKSLHIYELTKDNEWQI